VHYICILPKTSRPHGHSRHDPRPRAPSEEKMAVTPLLTPNNDAFSYFAAVIKGSINPENDLGSLKINMVAMQILEAALKSSKTHKTIFLK
jgi:hypothetical protein